MSEALTQIVGMTLDEARDYLDTLGYRVRATSMNGQPLVGTCDYNLARVNVAVVDHKIVSIEGLG